MFFRTMFKINRYLQPNKNSLFQYGCLYKSYRNHNSKATYGIPSLKQVKLSSTYTRNLEQRKNSNLKLESTAMTASHSTQDDDIPTTAQDDAILKPKSKPLSIEEQKVQGLQPSSMPNYYTSNMSNLSCFPEEVSPIRRKFEKSSTQNALTMPFKLARLANPFPEPVKTQISNTISDEEKSMQMQEEAKMEARYRMQQQQEALIRQQNQELQQRKQQMQEAAARKQMHSRPQEEPQAALQEPIDEESLNEPAQMKDQKGGSQRAEKKQRTRSTRYLKKSRNPRTRTQERKYSSDSKVMHPEMMSDIEQCELIWQRIRSQHPELKSLRRPVCIPGSQEEKEFVKATLKFIAKHKIDLNRQPAPFPSYSEVKTFVREPKIHEVKFGTLEALPETDAHKEILAMDTRLSIQNRKYSTKSSREDICAAKKKPAKKVCTKLTVEPCKKAWPTACEHFFSKEQCKKTEAPYPSYSECCDDGYVDEHSECKVCPPRTHMKEVYKGYKRKYTTCAAATAAPVNIEAQPKSEKKPCENPCRPPECDYAETAKRNKARQGRGSKGPIKKKKPKKLAAPPTMFEKIRKVFVSPEQENTLTKDEPREIHVIQLTDNTIVTSKNIPGFMACSDSVGCGNKNKGCPKQKKKDKNKKEEKKCRFKRKRPLPSCKDKPKKKKAMDLPVNPIDEPPFLGGTQPQELPPATTTLFEQIHVNDEMRIVEPTINIMPKTEAVIEATTTGGSSPFKLKQQYWKINK